ncbi:MAG: hypothetical protein WA087_04075 [Candidatus Saccharimonadales bacterium]
MSSPIFQTIHHEITEYQKELEERRKIARKSVEETLAEDRAILQKSGVKEIFEEIRRSGLVKLKPNVESKKRGFFAGLFSDEPENDTKNQLDYVPAEIIDNGYSISLRFDELPNGCSEVRIAVINGALNIAHGYNRVDYTPVEKGDITGAIIDGLKNPLRVDPDAYIE